MGVGRREFLKLMAIASAGVTMAPKTAVAVNDDYYINRKLGVIFSKPKNWGYVALTDFPDLQEKQIISNVPTEEQAEVWETLGGPACMITKYFEDLPEYKGVFSPTIQFFVNHKSEFDDIEYNSFEELIDQSGIGTAYFLKDFERIGNRKSYDVDGCTFFEHEARYTFEHIELSEPISVRLQVIMIEHNNFYYFINFHDCPEQNQTATEEFKNFKKSLRMI
ncbi:MAG: hypothetical protein ACFHU9_03720 [Fluviicola sp.]